MDTRGMYPYPEPVIIQWQSSGNPVCLELKPLTLDKELLVASVLPVCFQWYSIGLPVVIKRAPVMQINTGLPLGYRRVLTWASVVPVASQCTCGSSDLPVCSNYANRQWIAIGRPLGDSISQYCSSAASGVEVIMSGHFPACKLYICNRYGERCLR